MSDSISPNDQPNSPQDFYRPCVGIALFNDEGLVWVGKRVSDPGIKMRFAWQMPQGGIDSGESPEVAAMRELEEETGTQNAIIIREATKWFSYDLPQSMRNTSKKGVFRGQTQKWFALRFTGKDSEFRLDTHDKPEFSSWKWVSLDEVPELIVPFKRNVYIDVVKEFKDLPERIADE